MILPRCRLAAWFALALISLACSGAPPSVQSSDAGPDAGKSTFDGGGQRDAGSDAGQGTRDAGTAAQDAGSDAGSTSQDAGSTSQDGGSTSQDAGLGPADAGSMKAPVTVDWCNVQWPHQIPDSSNGIPLPRAGQVFGNIYAQVYSAGVTNVPGNEGDFQADIGYGPVESHADGSNPPWTWIPATFNTTCTTCNGNNYEYRITLTAPAPGTYNYAARFSTDGRRTYQYCAGAGTQGGQPYQPHSAYVMWVVGPGCEADETVCGTGSDCCSGSCSNSVCQPGPPTCTNGQMLCGNACVDPSSDPNNCGHCGQTCPTGVCIGGACSCITRGSSASCSSDAQCCSGSCDPGTSACQCVGPAGQCASDVDCCPGSGGICQHGRCGFFAPGASCASNPNGCTPGFQCVNGTCTGACFSAGQGYGASDPSMTCCSGGSNGTCSGCSSQGGRCATDADCCASAGPCIGGYCAAGCVATGNALPNNEQCNSATEIVCCSGNCASGTYATCAAPVCAANDWRFACTCSPAGYPCAHDVDCCGGTCNGTTCQGSAACFNPGAFCTDSSQCCGQNCQNGVCTPGNWKPGSACLTDLDCASGVCSGGGCACQGTSALCRSDADCCSGACANYTWLRNEMIGECR